MTATEAESRDTSLKFVVLRHTPPAGSPRPEHYDLMLEAAGVLRTWALAAMPQIGVRVDCQPLPDHRTAYLQYEGPVSGGRGEVRQIAAGTYVPLVWTADRVVARLAGENLEALVELRCEPSSPLQWSADFRPLTVEERP